MPLTAVGVLLALVALPQPERYPAEVEDAYALRVNPAGLAFVEGAELRLLYGHDRLAAESLGVANGVGLFGAWRPFDGFSLGAAWERDWLRDREQGAFRLGLGVGGGPFAFGATWNRIDRLLDEDRDRIDLGLSLRPSRWLAMGAALFDLSEQLAQRVYDLSLAVRPGWDRLLISGRWRLVEGEPVNDDTLDLAGRVLIEPLPGLQVGVGVEQDLDVSFQLAVDLAHVSLGGFASFVEDQVQAGGELVVRTRPLASIITIGKVAVIELNGALVPEPSFDLLRQEMRVPSYGDAPRAIEALAGVDGVVGAYVRLGELSIGWAKAEELRRAVTAVRRAGRRVDCYLGGGSDIAYYIATACTEIIVPPPTLHRIDGLSTTSLYLGEALARFGIRVEVERIGSYKNAPDRLTRGGMSPEERERLDAFLDVVFGELVARIAEGRELPSERVRALIDEGIHTSTGAAAAGLVDTVLYPDAIEAHLFSRYGGQVPFVPIGAVFRAPSPRPWRRPSAIAVIHIDAPITSGRSEASPFGLGRTVGARDLVEALERARSDPGVVAVVLRVDSPGGDAGASDFIARAVARTAEAKPVIASFSDVAASGGYYVSAPATRIFAESTSLTGSIGIYSVDLDLSGLLERLGVGVEVLTRGEVADATNPFTARGAPAEAAVRRALLASYHRFLTVVAEGRGLDLNRVRALAEGRVYSGQAAVEVGLVDELGGLNAALRHAARAAGKKLGELEVITLPDPFQSLGSPLSEIVAAVAPGPPRPPAWLRAAFGGTLQAVDARLPLLARPLPLALFPFLLEVE